MEEGMPFLGRYRVAQTETISSSVIRRDPDPGDQRAGGTPESGSAAQLPYALLISGCNQLRNTAIHAVQPVAQHCHSSSVQLVLLCIEPSPSLSPTQTLLFTIIFPVPNLHSRWRFEHYMYRCY